MQVDELSMVKEKAEEEFKKYSEVAIKKLRKEQKLIKQVYNYLRKGKRIIDLNRSFEIAGLNELGQPKLAIARADWEKVTIVRNYDKIIFKEEDWSRKENITISNTIFEKCNFYKLETPLPYVPPYISIYDPKKFYILWEVEGWKKIQPRDPILLKKISNNFYLVCNFWNLTEIERKIMNSFVRS